MRHASAPLDYTANPPIAVRVKTACGESWVTHINATPEQARVYFVGQWFNIGREDDRMVRVVSMEVLPC